MATVTEIRKVVAEPKWERLLADRSERAAAKAHWRRVTAEMADAETLAPTNGHALQRLVLAYVAYDRCSQLVAIHGEVLEPSETNPKAIARLSPHYHAMRQAMADAERLEAQLGFTPQRRGKVSKVKKRITRSVGADAFLGTPG